MDSHLQWVYKAQKMTKCPPLRGDTAEGRGEVVLRAKSRVSEIFSFIPTEIFGVILSSFHRPSSLMKVRQTRRTAMIKTTGLDKEIQGAQSQLSAFLSSAA